MNEKYLEELIEEFLKIKDKKVMKNFLFGLLASKELEQLPIRLQIIKMLKKGIPQIEIANRLRVGIATVTRGSKEIQKGKFINIT